MLNKKVIRDFFRNKSQFISIFLMIFLSTFIFCGVGSEYRGMDYEKNNLYNKTNLANMWVYKDNVTSNDVDKVKKIDNVKKVERRLELEVNAKMDNNPHFSLYFLENNDISKIHVIKGEEYSNDKDGIWVFERFAKAKNLDVGDKITLTFKNMDITKTIKALVISPEYVFEYKNSSLMADYANIGYGYISSKYFINHDLLVYNQLLIDYDDDNKDITKDVEKNISNTSAILKRDDHPSYYTFENEILQHSTMANIFTIIFLIVALLTIATTMNRLINKQRGQIGTLKALGFSKTKIMRHYLNYGIYISIIASVLGAIIGPLTLPKLFYPSMSSFYTLEKWHTVYNIDFLYICLICIILCSASILLSCYQILKEKTVDTLRLRCTKKMKHLFIERFKFFSKLSFIVAHNIRDIFKNKSRSIMMVFGSLGCCALLICAFSMNSNVSSIKEWEYGLINKYNYKADLKENVTNTKLNDLIIKYDAESIEENRCVVEINSESVSTNIIIVDDNSKLVNITDNKQNKIELPKNGISITNRFAKSNNIKVNDTIKWQLYGDSKWYESKVLSINSNPLNQGIVITKSLLKNYSIEYKATALISNNKILADDNTFTLIQDTNELKSGLDTLLESMNTMVYVLIIAAISLSFVVVYNLNILSFTELERDFSTLKVLGFTNQKIFSILLFQSIFLSIIGYLIGIPIGQKILGIIAELSGDEFDLPNKLYSSNIIYSFILIIGTTLIINMLFYNKIKKLNMVETLKMPE